jgi:hypothetical protein
MRELERGFVGSRHVLMRRRTYIFAAMLLVVLAVVIGTTTGKRHLGPIFDHIAHFYFA